MIENRSSSFVSQVHLQRLQQLCEYYSLDNATKTDVQTLADQLNCSERNVSKLMKKMDDIGWVSWVPGRGRGNKSEVTIRESFPSALMKVLEQCCKKGYLSEAARYAAYFGYSNMFRNKLSNWLMEAQDDLKKPNTLIVSVPYSFPELHPLFAYKSNSRLYIKDMYDTLLKYDVDTGVIKPNLAHYYEFTGNELRLRVRPDVYFHNGVKMTSEHVVKSIEDRIFSSHTYRLLYRHILNVQANGCWVIITLSSSNDSILHLLSEVHASIYLTSPKHKVPLGTGAYFLEENSKYHWTLVKNPNYFTTGGLVERVEFWTSDGTESSERGHIVHYRNPVHPSASSLNHSLQLGCDTLEFQYHSSALSMDEKAWIFHKVREFCQSKSLATNSVIGYHQNKRLFLYHQRRRQPTRLLRVYISGKTEQRLRLLEYLRKQGLELEFVTDSKAKNIDFSLGGYKFSDDRAYSYYKWLICSSVFTRCLSNNQQQVLLSIVDQVMFSSVSEESFLNGLFRCEDWLIQSGAFFPLWRYSDSYDIDYSLHGFDAENQGMISLRELWLDKD